MGSRPRGRPIRVGFMASHGGSAAREIAAAGRAGVVLVEGVAMISNNSTSAALAWASSDGLNCHHISARNHPDPIERDHAVEQALTGAGAEVVVLSGYNQLVGPATLARFRNRVLNVHPAPLPDFGGQGMYGLQVHEAVLEAGLDHTAVTIHLIDEAYDRGPAVSVTEVPVPPRSSPEQLAEATKAIEGTAFVQTLAAIVAGEIDLDHFGAPLRLPYKTG